MSARSPIGRPIIGRPRHSRTLGSSDNEVVDKTDSGHHNRYGSSPGQHNVGSIPQVPSIPNRFLPGKENNDCSHAQGHMQNLADEKNIYLRLIPAPHTRYLPNCSFGKPKEVQVISNAMMQAYLSMRGNCLGGQDGVDPLFEWIQKREELAQTYNPKIHNERDVSKMLWLIDKALVSSTAAGDSPRDSVFEVYRPDFEHIKPPQDMDMSANEFVACCSDFEWEEDSDDEEADVPSGRVSPCTFLEWSKDCVRWNANENLNKKDTTSYIRIRPHAPTAHAANRQHEDTASDNMEAQWDINTGEQLTPAYFVPTSPSIIYTPPGVDFAGFRTANFHAQYRRMAPLVERQLRSKIYGGPEAFPSVPDSEKATFSLSEVHSATAEIPELHHRAGREINAALRSQWAAIAQAEAAEKALYKQAELQRAQIDRLQLDQRHMREFLPALHARRELRERELQLEREREMELEREMEKEMERKREMEMEREMEREREREQGVKARRRDAIRAYVAEHALDAQSRLDMACFRLHFARAGVADSGAHIADLERDVRRLCVRGGVRDPEHAYAVLMGAAASTSSSSLTGSGSGSVDGCRMSEYGHGRGYGGSGVGSGVGSGRGPMGPWSESSLGRAEGEYDRFLADMKIRGARGRASSREWESHYADDGSSDSGVAGVEGQGQYRSHYQESGGLGYRA